MASEQPVQPWAYLLLLFTLVVMVTYNAGFNPPGGVWQETRGLAGRLAGDPIIRHTHYVRYMVFFCCNATAFAASIVVIVLILALQVKLDKEEEEEFVLLLRAVMSVDALSLMGAYCAGTCWDKLSTVYNLVLVAACFIYIVVRKVPSWCFPDKISGSSGVREIIEEELRPETPNWLKAERRLRKTLMLFAVSITYVAGLSTPGGFWASTGDSNFPGDPVLRDRHGVLLTVFMLCNTTSFVASLLIIDKRLPKKSVCIFLAIVCLVAACAAYAAGSCTKMDTTLYLPSLAGAVVVYSVLHVAVLAPAMEAIRGNFFWTCIQYLHISASEWLQESCRRAKSDDGRNGLHKAGSLVLLLATLAATVTYTAGLHPPGGVWQDNIMAGYPILLTTNPRRYKAFYYCNSVAFVASLVVIIMVHKEVLVKHRALEAAMILDLFGLIGGYAAGSCRDVNTSIHVMSVGGAVLVYVVIHVLFFSRKPGNELLEKRRKRLFLFAILAATFTFQAGLSPPGGFLLQDGNNNTGHRVGDPVLLYNSPSHYKVFFYCNSVSFMLSITLMILLTNPNLYRPAIQSNALSVCTVAGLFCLMGAYAAGSTQDVTTSIYIFVLVATVLLVIAVGVLRLFLFVRVQKKSSDNTETRAETSAQQNRSRTATEEEERKTHTRRKHLMLIGILLATVTYQAGLQPPGGIWQSSGDGYEAGDPVMHANMRPRYLVFFYSNSTSFVASIAVIVLLLCKPLQESKGWLTVMNTTILLDLVALLGAYVAGSSRGWKTSAYVVALVVAVLGYFAIHMTLSFLYSRRDGQHGSQGNPPQSEGEGDGGHEAQEISEL